MSAHPETTPKKDKKEGQRVEEKTSKVDGSQH